MSSGGACLLQHCFMNSIVGVFSIIDACDSYTLQVCTRSLACLGDTNPDPNIIEHKIGQLELGFAATRDPQDPRRSIPQVGDQTNKLDLPTSSLPTML